MRLPLFVVVTLLLLADLSQGTPARADASPAGGATVFHSVAAVNVTAHPLTPTDAPADEYFGRLKLSNIGVHNIIHALAVEGYSPLALPLERTRIMGVETAIVEWAEAFPRDPWLHRRDAVVHVGDPGERASRNAALRRRPR